MKKILIEATAEEGVMLPALHGAINGFIDSINVTRISYVENDTAKEIKKRLRYNSHDMGELGKFVRLEYAYEIVKNLLNKKIS
jgi:hypothetical protein